MGKTASKNTKPPARKGRSKTSRAKNLFLPVICAVVVVAAAAIGLLPKLLGGNGGDAGPGLVSSGSDVEIDVSALSESASFYDYDAGGVTVELLALRDKQGDVRLALNTCQVCAGSPYAYFVQSGDSFICQNCGNVFPVEVVGVDASDSDGCNPVPVTNGVYTLEDGVITVPAKFLEDNAYRFTNWKKF